RGQLVDEALDHEDAVRGPDAAPERGRNPGRLLADVFHPDVGKGIRRLRCAFHRVYIEAFDGGDQLVEADGPHDSQRLGEQLARDPRHDRRAGDAMGPGDRPAALVQAGGDAVVVVRPVHIVLDVFLAGPYDFHGPRDLHGDPYRPADEVHLEPSPEAAAQEMVVHLDAL